MKLNYLLLSLCFFFYGCQKMKKDKEVQHTKTVAMDYPQTKKVDSTDTYFGTTVKDPYQWMEDMDSPEVAQWVKNQQALTQQYLDKLPWKESLQKRYKKLLNYEKMSTPSLKNDRLFYTYNTGLRDQSVVYMKEGKEGKGEVLLDPNTFSEDGTVALSAMAVSKNGKYLAYATSSAGSDWKEAFVMNIENREKLDDHVQWIKFTGLEWYKDGFFYGRFPEPTEGEDELSAANKGQKIYYHKVGTPQAEDQLIYEDTANPNNYFGLQVTDDERFLILSVTQGAAGKNNLMYKDLEKDGAFQPLVEGFDSQNSVVTVQEGYFYIKTDYQAPNGRLVKVDPSKKAKDQWEEVIPETEGVLKGINFIGEKFLTTYMVNASSKAYVFNTEGKKEQEIELPGIGSVYGFGGHEANKETYFTFTSYNYPHTIFHYDIQSHTVEEYWQADVPFEPQDFKVEQRFFESKDGTEVPLFLVYHKRLNRDSTHPAYVYGYGGFNISLTPGFQVSPIPYLQEGGVYAVVNLRGGGEFGQEWHEAGMLENKQNVFDDFIAANNYLIAEGISSPDQIAIAGGSNGGLLVGACMTQEPDLFAAALPSVGVMDMLRFHKFTIGWAWTSEYGHPEEDSAAFENLYSYSPYHNLEKGVDYPATLVKTADHDDRVVPAHSFKFISRLQEYHGGTDPVLIRIESKAGHGAGKPISKIIDELADTWAFVFKHTGVPAPAKQG